MQIVHSDSVFQVDARHDSELQHAAIPLLRLHRAAWSASQLAAEREYYHTESMQYLLPFEFLEMYGPAGADYQTSSIRNARTTRRISRSRTSAISIPATRTLVRGWVTAGRLDRAVPPRLLSRRAWIRGSRRRPATSWAATIKLWIQVGGNVTPALIARALQRGSDRYEIEFWGYPGRDLRGAPGPARHDRFDRGALAGPA